MLGTNEDDYNDYDDDGGVISVSRQTLQQGTDSQSIFGFRDTKTVLLINGDGVLVPYWCMMTLYGHRGNRTRNSRLWPL